ncbi:MAG: S-layer homology domain-containing protein [Clostridia bacterium]|nr:S-layer homology domain-containing protein [Clostridia bacterium]
MKRMKATLLGLAACLLLASLALPALASGKLTYAVDAIASQFEMVLSAQKGKDVTFSKEAFEQAIGANGIESIEIKTLPAKTEGMLKLAGNEVQAGQSISADLLSSLHFTPANETVEKASFTFTCGNLCGGAEILCRMRFTDGKNEAPTLSSASHRFSLLTQKNVSVFGSMQADDPENDAMTYLVVSYPKNGTLTITDKTYGDFCYTPAKGFRGKDSFSYVVRDSFGNYSPIATVSIQVSRRVTDVTFDDMAESFAHNGALAMTAQGIMQGEIEGDGYYFKPKATVSRSEFVVMAMKAMGIRPDTSLTSTFFDDNDKIQASEMSYIATAQKMGFIVGNFDGKGLYFAPDEAITRAEASVILTKMAALSDKGTVPTFAGDDIPVWAEGSMELLYAVGAIGRTEENSLGANSYMTREETAQALYTLMQLTR